MKNSKKTFYILLLSLLLTYLVAYVPILYSSGHPSPPEKSSLVVPVVSVIDGDTILIRYKGREVPVRFIGIDCPETGKYGVSGEYGANRAKELVARLTSGKKVTLKFDFEREDRYHRWLCYVYTEDGGLVNELLLEEGLALAMTRFPFTLKKQFLRTQREASEKGKGMFSNSSIDAVKFTISRGKSVEVYRGPSRSYILVFGALAKPWLTPGDIPLEIDRIRRYERSTPPERLYDALKADGYVIHAVAENKGPGLNSTMMKGTTISYRDAVRHMGESVAVKGKIVRTHQGAKATFLDFDSDWKHNLSIVIFSKDIDKFSSPPHMLFLGKMVIVKGRVRRYKEKPEIIVNNPNKITIIK